MARVLSSATLLAFLVLLGMAAAIDGPRELPPAGAAAAPAPAGPTKCDAPGRRIYEIKLPDGSIFPLCLPRLLNEYEKGYPRTFNDTCGLYTLVMTEKGKKGTGPPPHIHYAEDEWFFPVGEGQTRLYQAQKARTFIPGELPGFNGVPPVKMGSAVLQKGDILYSPHGNVHFFYRETDTTEWWTVHHGGRNSQAIVTLNTTGADPEEILKNTALFGVPHDASATFVGETEDTFRDIRGPVELADPQLERLQALFDAGEACYPADGMTPEAFVKPPAGVPYVEA